MALFELVSYLGRMYGLGRGINHLSFFHDAIGIVGRKGNLCFGRVLHKLITSLLKVRLINIALFGQAREA
jgi:hypothetical protein